MALFKDRVRKSASIYNKMADELITALDGGPDDLKKLLIPNDAVHIKHVPDRSGCGGVTVGRVTEKRLCRCLFFNNSDLCLYPECLLKDKFLLEAGKYKVTDYEVPAYYSSPGIGEIDLIISDGEKQYATEVKPKKGNRETILRMISEILTYTVGYDGYENAIAFFEGSPQHTEYEHIGEKIKEIIEKADIKVFEFAGSNGKYKILRIR